MKRLLLLSVLFSFLVIVAVFGSIQGKEFVMVSDTGVLSSDVLAPPTKQIIIKFTGDVTEMGLLAVDDNGHLPLLSAEAGVKLTYFRPMSGDAHVLQLPDWTAIEEVEQIAAKLYAMPGVEYAEPDRIKMIDVNPERRVLVPSLTPNDTHWNEMWHLRYTANTSEGMNLVPAWDITTGSASTVVAVIDTGILNHTDLAGKTVAGYDFISDVAMANDGNGRDSNPADPGDWVVANECYAGSVQNNSSWHGTHVAGIIGAASNNNLGITGVNWNAKILPLRVLGKCGGTTSDIVDAMRWAAGLAVTGVPANANPADVLNLSLGGFGDCSISEQNAINAVVATGASVVIAAGNENDDAADYSPGNCNNVITVAATDKAGDRAYYSNYGSVIEVSGPGGAQSFSNDPNGVLSTLDSGTTAPANDNAYVFYQGTSMATAQVAGLASLIKGMLPDYTQAQVLSLLQITVRDFPVGSTCNTSICGIGIVDAFQALDLWATGPYNISGTITDSSNNPLPDVIVSTNMGQMSISDINGDYNITGLLPDTYTITPIKTGYTFSPSSRTVILPPNATDQGFIGSGRGAKTPIIFIPGLMGSRLYNTVDGQNQELWADVAKISSLLSFPHPLMPLALAPDGLSPAKDEPAYNTVHTIDGTDGIIMRVTGTAWGLPIDESFYETIVNHFAQEHNYVENQDFWVYPYDWRKDLRQSADDLDSLIRSVLDQTQATDVYLIAHSLGGLVTRQYITEPDQAAHVRHAIILGTPFLGTPKAFYVLQEGDCFKSIAGYCLPKKHVLQELVPNYPSFSQIMPSVAYFWLKGGGYYGQNWSHDAIRATCSQCLTYEETYRPIIAPSLNITLTNDARLFHNELDHMLSWNNVPVTILGGYGQETIVGIREYQRRNRIYSEPVYSASGDGTVSELSVSLVNSSIDRSVLGTANYRSFRVGHQELTTDPEVLTYIDTLLGLSPEEIAQTAEEEGVTATQIVAHGVTSIHSYDHVGNHTGPLLVEGTSFITEQAIPGSAYFSNGSMATVGLIGGQTYTLTVVPSGLEPVDISLIRSTLTETLTTTLYLGIATTDQSIITLIGDPFVVDTWQLDLHGDGNNVQIIEPTTIFEPDDEIDVIPPLTTTITLEGLMGPHGWYISPVTVTLSATDNITGTGIARIEYAFNLNSQIHVYTGPFAVEPNEVGLLYAMAVDRAGNMQVEISRVRIGPDRTYLPILIR